MDLGNQSYDAISPLPQIQLITPPDNMSTTASAQSTAYLSFAEDSSDDGMDDDDDDDRAQPYAHLGASIGADGAFGPASAQPQLHYHQPAVLHPSLIHGPYHNSASPPHTSRLLGLPTTASTGRESAPALGRAGSDRTLGPVHPEGQSLGLFPVPAREPRTPASHPTNASVAVGAGARDASYFRAAASASASPSLSPSASGSPAATAASYVTAHQGGSGALHSDSASELSDLDFMSDYQPSEMSSEVSDLGEASDGSWSVASAGDEDAGRVWRA